MDSCWRGIRISKGSPVGIVDLEMKVNIVENLLEDEPTHQMYSFARGKQPMVFWKIIMLSAIIEVSGHTIVFYRTCDLLK